MTRLFSAFFILILVAGLYSCGQHDAGKTTVNDQKTIRIKRPFVIDTFSVMPPEIDGCGCYLSNDSAQSDGSHYIFVSDMESTAFMKINGVMVKFIKTGSRETGKGQTIANYKSHSFKMTIETTDGLPVGDEGIQVTGTIQLTDQKGSIVSQTFYGVCGC